MAKKRKQTQIEEYPRRMQEHIRQLRLSSVEAYKIWCRTHNFSQGLNKRPRQLRDELGVFTRTKATEIMTKEKKGRNLKALIPKLYSQKLPLKQLTNATAREIGMAFQESDTPKILLKLLLYIEDNSNLLQDVTYIQGITALTNHYASWRRPIEQWHVKSHNRDRQFAELTRHLFAAYDVPLFMDAVWFSGNEIHQNWFKHIAAGQNIRTAPNMPVSLTKKMAHHFLKAPEQYTVEEALRWGQVHALGGDRRLVDALRGTRLIRTFNNDSFWLSVIRFFIANPMLDVSHVNPIIDYIWNQKYENRHIFAERGVAREIEPAQPNFSMKGRTPETLLRRVEEWHQQLGRETKGGKFQWTHSHIGEFRFREGSEQRGNMKLWTIRELLSSDELIYEGRAMRHCVRTYAKSCYAGQASIWTMETEEDADGRDKILTIEVSPSQNLIRQVRGKLNRRPTPKEKTLLERWATKEGLQLAEYI